MLTLRFSMIRLLTVSLLLFHLTAGSALSAHPEPPAVPPAPVVDLAGIIKADTKARLNSMLRDLERKTGAQFVILTVTGLDGEGIESFSLRMGEQWKLGKKGKDNGMLLAIALNDKKYRFETGYGLESILPDSFLGTLGREQLRPNFRKGDYSTGILNAASIIAQRIADDKKVTLGDQPRAAPTVNARPTAPDDSFDLLTWLLIGGGIILCLGFLGAAMLASRGRRSPYGGPHSGGWYGGGGFGGGGFGGGSDSGSFGGGGGTFGGGGTSGDWSGGDGGGDSGSSND